ncbi:MAG TPA: hypothetical protein VF755_04260, partial [Catenuloplanes sp.]
ELVYRWLHAYIQHRPEHPGLPVSLKPGRCFSLRSRQWKAERLHTKKLSIRPEYNLMIVRDAELPHDEEAARAARHRSGPEIAAASSEVVYICATQRIIPVQLAVKAYSRPRGTEDRSGWDGAFEFVVDFPSGLLHFGDTFHRADGLELPGGAGRYTVTVLHVGREAAFRALSAVDDLEGPEQQLLIDRNADVERYLVVVAPTASTGHPVSNSS